MGKTLCNGFPSTQFSGGFLHYSLAGRLIHYILPLVETMCTFGSRVVSCKIRIKSYLVGSGSRADAGSTPGHLHGKASALCQSDLRCMPGRMPPN